jgi:tartrate dehydratase alpha subunit/fumarate hydratase class I-like protein
VGKLWKAGSNLPAVVVGVGIGEQRIKLYYWQKSTAQQTGGTQSTRKWLSGKILAKINNLGIGPRIWREDNSPGG